MPLVSVLIAIIGGGLILLGLMDAFLTILHPDRDGRLSATLNRGIWYLATILARVRTRRRHETLGFAGPTMVISDVLLWMLLPILGYGILVWPFMSGAFDTPTTLDRDLWDAIYFSGVTFTTLGFGDITPLTPVWELLSIAEAITGFLVMSTSIAYIVAVFEGVDQRDALALKIYSETGGTWNGALFVSRALEDEGADRLRGRVEGWASLVRDLHGRLYRFHGLALYLRTHGLDLGPERMLYALTDVTLRCQVLARAPEMRGLRPAADHLAIGVEHFAGALVRRHGTRRSRELMERPEPTERDIALVGEVWTAAAARFALSEPAVAPGRDAELLALAARLRVFLSELDRLTRWRTLEPGAATRAAP
ncbi:MAG TPA: ion channel [Candidatus Thermoplasmatota archaeon]|nr:ion channel [Candidatus Thermoplasmatota archaeon]